MLHEDEKDFSARLRSSGPSLDFAVNFLGHGFNPPHAFHSEGHQGSMGLCLFLALSEKVTVGRSNLVVLDDVVMSIDSGHRKSICRLLKEKFSENQFIITTHDKTWSKQLKQGQVVESNRVKEILRWSIETGPHMSQQLNMWEEIEDALSHAKVDNAAFTLRKGSEEFFEMVCDALAAPVTYNSNGQWQLDDWLPAAMERYKKLSLKAKGAANSWGYKEVAADFTDQDSIRKQIFGRSHVEQWSINALVHHNSWESLSKVEFAEVVDAFEDLHRLFICSCCGGLLCFVKHKGKDKAVQCPCGKVNWNLERKQ